MNAASQALQSFMVPTGGYGYTGTPVANLTSFNNTIVQALLDESGSTAPFAKAMEECIKTIVRTLRKSPQADNLIYRQCHFATNYREHHGFMPLAQINETDYDGCYHPGGSTTLYDSNDRALRELHDYAKEQVKKRYACNGLLFALTDGRDYGSTLKPKDVRGTLVGINADESLESLLTILIGVNDDAGIQRDLQAYAAEVGFSHYQPLSGADEKTLGKLAGWVSQQIQSQSQSLGSGGPSKVLTF